eukprot:TRINITY_DN12144_c0_g1_i1.p1 TRINITY_DN12144_c0_g1~~TRINITY_DN12144_c0_g1_i1.p1  ORF type:complete len:1949 (-),score=403.68 TRINITY_DN12144_c0_g1_i1:11-5857(-)
MDARLPYACGRRLPYLPSGIQTLPEALEDAAKKRPTAGLTLYEDSLDGRGVVRFVSYPMLLESARRVAKGLQASASQEGSGAAEHGGAVKDPRLAPGSNVLLCTGRSRGAQLIGFWGSLLAGLVPCFVFAEEEQNASDDSLEEGTVKAAWESLGRPIILLAGKALQEGHLSRDATMLNLADFLDDQGALSASVYRAHPFAAAFRIVVMPGSGQSSMTYSYSHDAVLANCLASKDLFGASDESLSSLSWMPLASPCALLAHCTAITKADSEVHIAAPGGEPRKVLRVAARHKVSRVVAPAIFFRRALGPLRADVQRETEFQELSLRKGKSFEPMALACVRLWVVTQTDNQGLRPGEAEEFLALVARGSESPALGQVLLAPWGSLLAGCIGSVNSDLMPVQGMELKITSDADGSNIAVLESEVGHLRARGLAALPGLLSDKARGWAPVAACRASLVGGRLIPGTSTGEDMLKVLGGVEYTPAEVEAAVELAPGVQPGSAAALMLPESTPSKSSPTYAGGLAIAFIPNDAAATALAGVVKGVKEHLAVTLGIRPQQLFPLSSSDLPRDSTGRPSREVLRQALKADASQSSVCTSVARLAQKLADCTELTPETLLPGEWIFEEEYRASPLQEGPAAEADGHDTIPDAGDEDDIEERMEGAANVLEEVQEEDAVGESTAAASAQTSTCALVVLDKTAGVGISLCSKLREDIDQGLSRLAELRETQAEGAAAEAERLSMEGRPAILLHLLQCDLLPLGTDGTEEAVSLIKILQAWERGAEKSESSPCRLRAVCVSAHRHVRVAGELSDPRKHFFSGVLLSAAAELPWLKVLQLDVSPGLSAESVAEATRLEVKAAGDLHPQEVLLDSELNRLARRLRPATLEPPRRQPCCKTALIAGGAGGIGALWARRLGAEAVILLGRSPPGAPRNRQALRELSRGSADVCYLCADLADKGSLLRVLKSCPAAGKLDFAANLCEAFASPAPLKALSAKSALAGPAAKLQGAENLLSALAALRPSGRQTKQLPVLLTSSAVSILGAAQLAAYAAGARGIEALCAREQIGPRSKAMDVRSVALSAWDDVGITAAFPVLSKAAPAAGLKVLSAQAGVLALEAVFQRFSAPRYGVLAVGIDAGHSRFAPLIGGSSAGSGAPAMSTATVPGCIELVQAAVRKILGRDAKLGDSFVEVGLDSMSSMSLHSLLCDSAGGLDLPSSLFYDQPTVLEVATFVHKQVKATGGDGSSAEEGDNLEAALEGMLEDADARRSYNLGLAREALSRGDALEARERSQKAAEGASGSVLASALSLEAEACELLDGAELAAETAYLATVHAREVQLGEDHPDTSVAVAKLLRFRRRSNLGNGTEDLQNKLLQARARFFGAVSWIEAAGSASISSSSSSSRPASAPSGRQLLSLMRLNLDGQMLGNHPAEFLEALGGLERLEVLKLRRNRLQEIPETLGRLVQLRELWLTCNMLADLPQSFSSLSKLQLLALERNRLPRLPDAIYSLRRLLQLGLDEQDVCLETLGERALSVQVLSVLRARGCEAAFPELQIPAGKPNLNTIFWANNGLPAVPKLLTCFEPSLRLLDLAHNKIATLSEELFCLHGLRDLSLAGNQLCELPCAIGQMRCLQQLWLHGNALESLPEELGNLQALAILELHHNRLQALPASISRLQKLNWLFAHGNRLTDGRIVKVLARLPRLKIVGLGGNRLQLEGMDLRGLRASYGLGWNRGLSPDEGILSEALTTTDLHWDRMDSNEVQEILVITFSAQGAPVAQGQAEVRALRDALIKVDALYVCDPANAWYLQDPDFNWSGLAYFDSKISAISSKYRRVFAWGGSMGGSAALLFAHLADSVHAFSPQVDLVYTWPSFATASVRETFRSRVQDSVVSCRGQVTVHVGEENHTDNRHAAALPGSAVIHLHETANHNTMKHLKQRGKLLPLLKFEVLALLVSLSEQASRQV